MQNVVIVSGKRTAIGSYGGSLKDTPVVELGAAVLKQTLKEASLRPVTGEKCIKFGADSIQDDGKIALEQQYDDYDSGLQAIEIDQVIMGNVLAAGQGQNIARQATIQAGIPKETSATTVNKLCASGIEAVALASQAIRCGDADVILAGGMESMSRVPYALPNSRWGQRMGDGKMVDLMIFDGLYEIFYEYHMGMTAENIATKYGISRLEQDEIGVFSHQRAMAAIASLVTKEQWRRLQAAHLKTK